VVARQSKYRWARQAHATPMLPAAAFMRKRHGRLKEGQAEARKTAHGPSPIIGSASLQSMNVTHE